MCQTANCSLLVCLFFVNSDCPCRDAADKKNLPFGVSCLRRVSFCSCKKIRKTRLRGFPLRDSPLWQKERFHKSFRHLLDEWALHLRRCRSSVEQRRIVAFLWCALRGENLQILAAQGTPMQRQKPISQPQERVSVANDSPIRYPRAENRTTHTLCAPVKWGS